MQSPSLCARQIARQALCDAENAIGRGEMSITRQRWVIAATERAGHDATRDQTLLATMEGNLGALETWRTYLLAGSAAEQNNGEAVPGHYHGPRPTGRSSLGSSGSD
jgi:hypothetical protein